MTEAVDSVTACILDDDGEWHIWLEAIRPDGHHDLLPYDEPIAAAARPSAAAAVPAVEHGKAARSVLPPGHDPTPPPSERKTGQPGGRFAPSPDGGTP